MKRWSHRFVAAGAGALALVLAFEFGDPSWFDQLTRSLRPAAHQLASEPPGRPDHMRPPLTVTPPRPLGNDSSVSSVALPLFLVRTELGRNNREGFAQIGVNARSPQTYAAGALLANGARLSEIYDRYVVLERDGRSARLYLQGEAQDARRRGDSSSNGLLTVGGTPAEATTEVTSQRSLTDYMRPSPVFVDGEVHGYALFAGGSGEAFRQLGLQPGDVVTRINGSAVSENADSLATLESLTEGVALSVVVERDGVAHSLSLDGSALKKAAPAAPLIAPGDFSNRATIL
jgi:hypothetical protein